MSRSRVGMTALAMLAFATTPDLLSAQPAGAPRLSLSRAQGQVMISAHADTLVVSHVLTPRSFALTLTDTGDRVRVTGESDGHVSVERGTVKVEFSVAAATREDASKARDLLSNSHAARAFDQLMTSDWARQQTPATTLGGVHALVGILRGNAAPMVAMINAAKVHATPRMTTVQRTPRECWRVYATDVVAFTYDLERCINDSRYSWNPLALGWCSYEYNLKTTLAAYWYLDCNGAL